MIVKLGKMIDITETQLKLLQIRTAFEESDHPRDDSGEFTSGGGGSSKKTNKKSEDGGVNKGFSNSQTKSIKKAIPDGEGIESVSEDMGIGNGKLVTMNDGSEYLHFSNIGDAEDAAKENMENLFDDIGIEGWNKDFAEQFITVDSVTARQIAIDDAESMRESLEDDDLSEEEIESQLDEHIDDVEQRINDDARGYFVEDEGLMSDEEFSKANFVTVDTDGLFDATLEADGVGQQLAGYDGEEIELDDGSFMYRTN